MSQITSLFLLHSKFIIPKFQALHQCPKSTGKKLSLLDYLQNPSVNFVLPFLSSSCDDATQLEQEISIVCEATCKIATTVLPHFTDHKKSSREFYSDHQLKQLCKESKSSWKKWRNAGRPLSGNFLEKKNLTKRRFEPE